MMDLATVHTLYEALAGDRLGFLYSGAFHDEHTALLIALGEELLDEPDEQQQLRSRLAFVMVEAYQNIIRHRAAMPAAMAPGAGRCLFALRSRRGGHEVVAINPLRSAEGPGLKALLGRIAGRDKNELKELFLARLQDSQRTGRGGAGLGLIEMARRSGHDLRHTLATLDADHDLFTLQVKVGPLVGGVTEAHQLATIDHAMAKGGVLLLCRGSMSPGMHRAMMPLVGAELDPRSVRAKALPRAWLAAVEWLEGLAPHVGDPVIALANGNAGHALVVGVTLPAERAREVAAAAEAINALDPGVLKTRYRDALMGRSEAGDAGMLGMLDLALHGRDALYTAQYPVNGGVLLLLQVLV